MRAGPWRFLMYLPLPQPAKMAFLRGTHDFVTCAELRALCRHGGLARPLITGCWPPHMSRLVPDPPARFRLEARAGRLPGLRHAARVLAVETRRTGASPR